MKKQSHQNTKSDHSTSGWVFDLVHRMGGPTGTAYTNTLQGTGAPAARLVREVIQNSTDAKASQKVIVRFRYERLKGDARSAFVTAAGLDDGFGPRKDKLGFDASNFFARSGDEALGVLYIEDYKTTGLKGRLEDSTSDFHRLLLSIGDDQKAVDPTAATGGSYGYGKAVLSSNSAIRTIFAYSLADENGANAKLLGCAYCSKHDHDGKTFTGRAWMGESSADEGVEPFLGENAHRMAEKLGFARRGPGEFGTSVLIADCTIDIEQLRHETETNWWPRLLDDELEVEFSRDGAKLLPPRPKSRADLRPFIECYDLAVRRTEPRGKHQHRARLNRLHSHELGEYAFEVLETDYESQCPPGSELANTVALVRSPKMVVAYVSHYARSHPPIAGVFVAHPDVDGYLKMSEPPDHSAWLATSGRLAKMPDREIAHACIEAVHTRLRTKAREFQAAAMPPPAKTGARLTRLERSLGAFFRTLGGAGDENGRKDPISVIFTKPPVVTEADAKRIAAAGEFEVKLKHDFPAETAEATIAFEVTVVEEGTSGEPLPVRMFDQQAGAKQVFSDGNGRIVKILRRNETYRFGFATDPYDKQWSIAPTIRVTLPEEEVFDA